MSKRLSLLSATLLFICFIVALCIAQGLFDFMPLSTFSSSAERTAQIVIQAESPILVTSGGHGVDDQMVSSILDKLELDHTVDNLATAEQIQSHKTLVVVVGGSETTIDAAGVTTEAELSRLHQLLASAKTQGLTIVALHVGGETRRGATVDQFIQAVFSRCNYAIVVENGDKDNFMADICADASIPINKVERISDVNAILAELFGVEPSDT